MKSIWKKKVFACLLALVMVVGMMPAAMADNVGISEGGGEGTPPVHEHNYTAAWQQTQGDDQWHWRPCDDSSCNIRETAPHKFGAWTTDTVATCSALGSESAQCTECNYKTTREIPKLAHTPKDTWESDETTHRRLCNVCSQVVDATANHTPTDNGVVTAPTCTTQGTTSHVCSICKRAYTIITANKLSHVDNNRDNKCDLCGVSMGTAYTVTFITGSGNNTQSILAGSFPSNPGTPSKSASNVSYRFIGWVKGDASNNVYTNQTTYTSAQIASNALPITSNTTYTAVYTATASNQQLSVTLNDGNGITFNSATSQSSAMRSQLYSQFSSTTGSALTHVRFTSSATTSYGTLYTNNSKTALYTNTDYSYGSGSYPLANVYFYPSGTRGTASYNYTAYDAYGNTMSGTLSFVTSNTTGNKISYTVAPGAQVQFNTSDFLNAYRNVYSGTPTYVTFSTSDTLDTSNSGGTVYYNYNGNDARAFTKRDIDDYTYYYSNSRDGNYDLSLLSFVAGSNANNRTVTLSYRVAYNSSDYVDGTVEINISGKATNKISYTVAPGAQVDFKIQDFNDIYQNTYSGNIRWVTFSTSSTMDAANGTIYYRYGRSNQVDFTRNTIDDYDFYYDSSSYGTYPLNELTFVAPAGVSSRTVTLSFRAYYNSNSYVDGTVEIKIGGTDASKITYTVSPGEQVSFKASDFNKVYQDSYSGNIRWVTFSAPTALDNSGGTLYYNYGKNGERSFTRSTIDDYNFYYSSSSYGTYDLDSLSFVAGSGYTTEVSLSFRAYYSDNDYVDGTVTLKPGLAEAKGDIRYALTNGTKLQINPNDIARFLTNKYSGTTLQYVRFDGAPDKGSLYYNYYSTSSYGAKRQQLTSSNYASQLYYFSPANTNQSSLNDLTYVPSGTNYCATIPFTAYATTGRTLSGNILISVNNNTVAEVYGVTTKGASVTLPSGAIYSAVSNATGLGLSGIRLISLPTPSAGGVYVGSGTSTRANTDTLYTYSGGSQQISQLRFVPATNFIGSVALPYVAYNSSGTAIASGTISLGVVNKISKYSDMNASTWCYKYVTELSDASVINGYENGSFQPNGTVTYGAALKLIMLSSGYSVQKPTDSHVFSGYLTRAKSDGLISGKVDLNKPISRQAVAQLAAKAMKLDTTNLSSVKPFTDTTDVYVQALNAAGIVEGYFNSGTSTFKPNNTLTRGQVSAIVWRMEQAGK